MVASFFALENGRKIPGFPCTLLPPCLCLGKMLCHPTSPPENLPVQEQPWFMFLPCVPCSRLGRVDHGAPRCTGIPGSGRVDPTAGCKREQPRASSRLSLTPRHGWSRQRQRRASCPAGYAGRSRAVTHLSIPCRTGQITSV